ncbi:MAG: redoxin domain-containing protein [Planctomycetales bacterium]|nr:redoxin domain-containing protein [Planctomycetales bacterium]
MMRPESWWLIGWIVFVGASSDLSAQSSLDLTTTDPLAGHSFHGEVFNEGPRQAAYLMPGMGSVDFEVSTGHPLAQKFFNQGVAQLHGFWYYEAERSFRQAALLDANCAMFYWGMAMANSGNLQRATKFMVQANERLAGCSARELLYIEAGNALCQQFNGDDSPREPKERMQAYIHRLEDIVEQFPEDIEAKAFLAVAIWEGSKVELPIVSHVAVDALLQNIFDSQPLHPAHHYRIHLWDQHRPERALASAAVCGQSLPGIAHMWHMPGHIYSRLHRYRDAVWQQEASARVDHAHMMRDRVLPDQIHNFAHNNEWLIRNLIKLGRISEAVSLAQNMITLPRHPTFNMPDGTELNRKGSSIYGRQRLLQVLTVNRMWPQLLELSDSMYLEPGTEMTSRAERLGHIGLASFLSGETRLGQASLNELESNLAEVDAKIQQLGISSTSDDENNALLELKPGMANRLKARANAERRKVERQEALRKLERDSKTLRESLALVLAARAAADQEWSKAVEHVDKCSSFDPLLKAEWLAEAGQIDVCLELLDSQLTDNPNEVPNLAVKTWIEYRLNRGLASPYFESLRGLAAEADMNAPLLSRLQPLATELGYMSTWTFDPVSTTDVGQRPELEGLGPDRWHPYLAPQFVARDAAGIDFQSQRLKGKPSLIIFYLGFGCLHCVEQLHAFSPRATDFRNMGINLLAISSEDVKSLDRGIQTYSKPLEVPLFSDSDLVAFKAFRCYDDFEHQPLHGTFLVDPLGRVLWQDISYEPFVDVDFALREAERLLRLNGFENVLGKPIVKNP